MKKLMPLFWMPALALVATIWPASQPCAHAADQAKPVAVLSIASVDQLMDDLAYFTKASGRLDVGGFVQFAGASFLQNLDRTKPAGVIITIDGEEPKGVGFLPAPDLDKLLAVFKDTFGAGVDDLQNGIQKLEVGEGVYLKQQGEWLFFSDSPKNLVNLPADPIVMLDGMHQKYSISFRLFVQNVPAQLRQMAVEKIRSDIEADIPLDQPGDPDIDGEFLHALRTDLQDFVTSVFNDSEQITVGWAVDNQNRHTYVEFDIKAIEGSPLSKQYSWLTNTQSSLTGFLMPDAAATVQGSARISQEGAGLSDAFSTYLRKKAMKGIDADPNAPEALKDIVNTVLDVFDKTVKEGRTDVATAVVLAPESFKFVGGVRVADGKALASAFEKLIELAKNQPDVPDVHFYADQHQGIDLHTFNVPIPDRNNDARKVLGENLDVVVGTGPKSLFFGFGKGSEDLLKTVIDKSVENGETPVPPVHFRIALKPLFNFLTSINPDDQKLATLADALEETYGDDGISFTVKAIENGFRCRLQVEEGVLKMLGQASRSSNGGF